MTSAGGRPAGRGSSRNQPISSIAHATARSARKTDKRMWAGNQAQRTHERAGRRQKNHRSWAAKMPAKAISATKRIQNKVAA